MADYRRVFDSRHLQADCAKNWDQLRNATLDNRVWATFTYFTADNSISSDLQRVAVVYMLFVLVQSFAVISQRQIEYNSSNNIKLVRSVQGAIYTSSGVMCPWLLCRSAPQVRSSLLRVWPRVGSGVL